MPPFIAEGACRNMGNTQNQACEEWVPYLAAYALGEQPDAELRTHLETCQRCRSELRLFGRVARVLPYSAPAVAPPPQLRDRIVAAAAGRQIGGDTKQPRAARRPRWAWSTLAWAGAVMLLLGWNIALYGQLRDSGRNFARLQDTLATTRNQLSAAQVELNTTVERLSATSTQLDRSRTNWGTVAVLFNSPDLQVASIGGEGAEARVWFTPGSSEACFVARGLPDPGAGKVYQLWLNQGDAKISGGTFSPVGDNAWIVVRADRPVASFGTLGVTVEPAGGSAAPTSPPVLRGTLSGSASSRAGAG